MTTDTDKLVEMARAAGFALMNSDECEATPAQLAAFRAAIIADMTADVEPVAWSVTCDGEHVNNVHTSEIEANRVKRNLDRDFPDYSREVVPLVSASTVAALKARATDWQRLYDRAINEANGLTNYVEDRPELRSAERRLDVIAADARALKGQP